MPFGLAAAPGGTQEQVTVVADNSGTASAQSDLMVVPDGIEVTQVIPSAPVPQSPFVLYGSGFLAAQALDPPDPDVPADPAVVVVQDADDSHVLARISPDGKGPAPADSKLTVTFPTLNVRASTPLLVSVVRGTLTSSPVPVLLGAGQEIPVTPEDIAAPRTVDGGQGYDYGSGVCTLNGQMRSSALSLTRPSPSLAFQTTTTIKLCTSREEVYSALDITEDTEASYGLASVSQKFEWAQSQDTVSTQLSLVVRSAVTSATVTLSNASLTPDASQLLENGDFKTFFTRYGDRFISGQVLGGEYVALLTIDTRSEQDRQTIAASLGASVSLGELDASVQTSVTSTLNRFSDVCTVNFTENRWGGQEPPATGGTQGQVLGAEEVMTKALDFPATVTADNAYPLQCVLADYSELNLPDPAKWLEFQQSFQPVRQRLLDIWTAIQTYQAQLQQVQYILAHPELYGEHETALNAALSPFVPTLQNAVKAATNQAGNYANTVMVNGSPSGVTMPAVPAPIQNIPWPSATPIPAYQILLAADNSWAVSCPDGDDPTAPLVIRKSDQADGGQQWQIPQIAEVAFEMTNVRTGLKATRNDSGNSVLQTTANDNTTLWRFVQPIAGGLFGGVVTSPTDLSRCFLETVHVPGDHLNLDHDVRIAGQRLCTWNDWDVNDIWTLSRLPDSTAPAGPASTFTVTITPPPAW